MATAHHWLYNLIHKQVLGHTYIDDIELTAFGTLAASFSTLALVPTLARRTITSFTQTETAACCSSLTLVTTLTVGATVAVSCVTWQIITLATWPSNAGRRGRRSWFIRHFLLRGMSFKSS